MKVGDLNHRWWALIVLCRATLMIVLDTTIVNVALPSLQERPVLFSQHCWRPLA